MRVWLQCGILTTAIALVCCMNPDLLFRVSAGNAEDKPKPATSDLQARFDHETNSVHKAKLFEKLSDEQLAEVRRASQSSDYNAVGVIMEKYRDNARSAVDALKKEHPNAEHQIHGYKNLQINIRRAILDLRETVLLAPDEFKPPLELVERDLSSIDDELLQSLFPSPQPHGGASPDSQPLAKSDGAPSSQSSSAPTGSALEQSPSAASQAASSNAPQSSPNANPSTIA